MKADTLLFFTKRTALERLLRTIYLLGPKEIDRKGSTVEVEYLEFEIENNRERNQNVSKSLLSLMRRAGGRGGASVEPELIFIYLYSGL